MPQFLNIKISLPSLEILVMHPKIQNVIKVLLGWSLKGHNITQLMKHVLILIPITQ